MLCMSLTVRMGRLAVFVFAPARLQLGDPRLCDLHDCRLAMCREHESTPPCRRDRPPWRALRVLKESPGEHVDG
eukprot:COSAG01_NODE_30342_length_617_cov_4.901544_1_plen_73_part_10